jgi:hypothetical protein
LDSAAKAAEQASDVTSKKIIAAGALQVTTERWAKNPPPQQESLLASD